MRPIKTRLLILLLLATTVVSGQKFESGYYIRSSGDTIPDHIFLRTKKSYILSVLSEKGQSFPATQLRGMGVNRIHYVVRTVSVDLSPRKGTLVDTVFLEVMARGKISLLSFIDQYDKSHYYIEREDGITEELGLKILDRGDGITFQQLDTYKQTLKEIFPSCTDIFPEIDKTRYNQNAIREVFDRLYQCRYGSLPAAETHKNIIINAGGILGFSSTDAEFTGNGSTAAMLMFDKSTDITGGVFVDFKFPRTGNAFSVRNELTHRKYKTTSADLYGNQGSTQLFGSVSASYIKYSLAPRIAFSHNKLRPFINFGVSPALLLSQTNKTTIIFSRGASQRMETLLGKVKKFELGFFGGAGLIYSNFSIEARVERSNGLQPELAETSPVNTLFILLSYRIFESNR